MAVPNNILQTVQTYQRSDLAFMQNFCCFVATANTRFKDFNKMTANLGDTVTFDLPPRMISANTLVANPQVAAQRVQSLICDKAHNVSYAFTSQQMIFNVEDYMDRFGKAAITELGSKVESDIASVAETTPYRFYGNGVSAINSYTQLATALAYFRDYSSVLSDVKMYLPVVGVPAIIGSGLNQFVPSRNEKIANSWDLGMWNNCEFYQSNFLPLHLAGNVGNNGTTLTVVSTNDPTGANITQITFSGAGVSDASAVFANDSFEFQDGVSGKPNLRYLKFVGHTVSANKVQFRATAAAASDGSGNVTVSISPALQSTEGYSQNLNYNIVAGMQVKALPDHRCGLIVSGKALFVAMPQLPDLTPFPTANEVDADTGVSLRNYYGATIYGQNTLGYTHDVIYGYTLVAENSMKIAFPATI